MIDHDQTIEDYRGPERAIFEREVESLPQSLLAGIVEAVMDYPNPHHEVGDRRDFLEIAIAEVSWASYFDAYSKIVGKKSALES